MSGNSGSKVLGLSIGIALGTVLAMMLGGVVLVSPTHSAAPTVSVVPAGGSTEQWAFGGNVSFSYSCSSSSCGVNATAGESLSFNYAIAWVVIYTQTNVSSTQTQEEVQAAVGATASLSLSECESGSGSGCSTVTGSFNVAGKEYGVDFTNVTPGGSVALGSGPGSPATVAAEAITNAASSLLYNFTGSYSVSVPASGSSPAESETANFLFGGNASSGITFATPFGLVPTTVQPGQDWSSNASYTAHGGYHAGYSISASYDGHSESEGAWTTLGVEPSGVLWENGTDLGAVTLYDNYTSPPSTVTAQEISILFGGSDNFSATDGWFLYPVGLFADIGDVFAHPESGLHAAAAVPYQGLGDLSTGESAFYQNGAFIGAAEATNETLPVASGASSTVKLSAGPEPVSVAQNQYSGILSGTTASSSGLPWMWLIIGVVVVVVVVIAIVAVVVLQRRRRPPTGAPAGMAPGSPTMPPPGYPAPPPPPGTR
jgi:hypothetical protein